MNSIFHKPVSTVSSFRSELFNNETFYPAFLNDLRACREVVIIELFYYMQATGVPKDVDIPVLRGQHGGWADLKFTHPA